MGGAGGWGSGWGVRGPGPHTGPQGLCTGHPARECHCWLSSDLGMEVKEVTQPADSLTVLNLFANPVHPTPKLLGTHIFLQHQEASRAEVRVGGEELTFPDTPHTPHPPAFQQSSLPNLCAARETGSGPQHAGLSLPVPGPRVDTDKALNHPLKDICHFSPLLAHVLSCLLLILCHVENRRADRQGFPTSAL